MRGRKEIKYIDPKSTSSKKNSITEILDEKRLSIDFSEEEEKPRVLPTVIKNVATVAAVLGIAAIIIGVLAVSGVFSLGAIPMIATIAGGTLLTGVGTSAAYVAHKKEKRERPIAGNYGNQQCLSRLFNNKPPSFLEKLCSVFSSKKNDYRTNIVNNFFL